MATTNYVPLQPPTGQDNPPTAQGADPIEGTNQVVPMEGGGALDSDLDALMGLEEHEERVKVELSEQASSGQPSYGPATSRQNPYRKKYDIKRSDVYEDEVESPEKAHLRKTVQALRLSVAESQQKNRTEVIQMRAEAMTALQEQAARHKKDAQESEARFKAITEEELEQALREREAQLQKTAGQHVGAAVAHHEASAGQRYQAVVAEQRQLAEFTVEQSKNAIVGEARQEIQSAAYQTRREAEQYTAEMAQNFQTKLQNAEGNLMQERVRLESLLTHVESEKNLSDAQAKSLDYELQDSREKCHLFELNFQRVEQGQAAQVLLREQERAKSEIAAVREQAEGQRKKDQNLILSLRAELTAAQYETKKVKESC